MNPEELEKELAGIDGIDAIKADVRAKGEALIDAEIKRRFSEAGVVGWGVCNVDASTVEGKILLMAALATNR